ncbi:MAG: hypothetical protein AAFQ43_14045 [Bacteroidota bacterium]
MSTFPHRKPPKPRHMERRSGRATARLQGAFNATPEPDRPLAPEAVAEWRAKRERFAQRKAATWSRPGEFAWAVVGVVGILFALFVIGTFVQWLVN